MTFSNAYGQVFMHYDVFDIYFFYDIKIKLLQIDKVLTSV